MSISKFLLQSVQVRVSSIYDKVREAVSEKVDVVKAFNSTPEFIGCDNPKMPLASDGTKCCFMFSGREPAESFASKLRNVLGVKVDVDSFIGYGTVYVPADKYEEAIQKGSNILIVDQNGCWVSFYDERKFCDFEPVLALKLPDSCVDKNGFIKKADEVTVKMWIKSLEKVLGEKILYDKYFCKNIELGITKTADAHLRHEEILNKIRESGLLENSPFIGYAYEDYYGKYIR